MQGASGRRAAGVVAVVATALATLAAAPALARPGGGGSGSGSSSSSTGYDISYPQCNGAYPSGQAFGIVGVNGGLANDANGCFSSELSWALKSPGLTSPAQPPASLYINTADPGPGTPSQPIADWPSTGSSTAYGPCGGGWTTACAYVYGQQRAEYSYGLVPSSTGSTAPWWLDIETANSWATSTTPDYAALNIAAIQGFTSGLQSSGATGPVGIYSTGSQWQAITGLNASTSPAYFGSQPDWVAGGRSLKGAKANCSASFTGGRVVLAQYPSGGFDADLACP